MTQIIHANTCATCGWKVGHGNTIFCRRYPPTQLVRIMLNPHTKQPEEAVAASFPLVKPEMWCGEYTALARGRVDAVQLGEGTVAGQHPALTNGRS